MSPWQACPWEKSSPKFTWMPKSTCPGSAISPYTYLETSNTTVAHRRTVFADFRFLLLGTAAWAHETAQSAQGGTQNRFGGRGVVRRACCRWCNYGKGRLRRLGMRWSWWRRRRDGERWLMCILRWSIGWLVVFLRPLLSVEEIDGWFWWSLFGDFIIVGRKLHVYAFVLSPLFSSCALL